MKIIQEGNLKKREKRFECEVCGCIWDADYGEYHVESDFRNGHYFVMKCPTCGKDTITHSEEKREK